MVFNYTNILDAVKCLEQIELYILYIYIYIHFFFIINLVLYSPWQVPSPIVVRNGLRNRTVLQILLWLYILTILRIQHNIPLLFWAYICQHTFKANASLGRRTSNCAQRVHLSISYLFFCCFFCKLLQDDKSYPILCLLKICRYHWVSKNIFRIK